VTQINAESWFSSGERVPVGSHELFVRVSGEGPGLTFLHAFPTSSWDWAEVVPALEGRARCLCFDFLGFGDSDKPRKHRYSIVEQADLTETLWERYDIRETVLVGHDYGATVAQELLARHDEGAIRVRLAGAVLLNGAVYVELARPLLVQRLLVTPGLGALTARVLGFKAFSRAFSSIFSRAHPVSPADVRQHWEVLRRREGTAPITHRLARYMRDREQNALRWETALEETVVPLRFVWGMADPRSGAHVADRIRERVPDATLVELPDVGHYPQLEVPARVAEEIAAAMR
jgi:pimeloyl-ACP methyl ester carboxylesterase